MRFETELTRRLGIAYPIIQAPMAGGGGTVELVAAVSEAGGLGSLGGAYSTAEQIAEMARAVRARTNRPFGINLFAPLPPPPSSPEEAAVEAVRHAAPFFAELDLPPPAAPTYSGDPFEQQLPAALESGASVFSFTFGIPPAEAIAAIKARGMMLMGTATTVAEARALEAARVDAIVAQGSEAGAHRGTFAAPFDMAMVGTIALVPQIVDAVRVPVIASGGIMDGRGIAAALALGAAGVQMGTAFLTCTEAGAPAAYKDAIVRAQGEDTRLTRAFSGRHARGIVNRFMTAIDAADAILPFPLQNALTRPMRTEAGRQNRPEFLSLWAGQGASLARRLPAAELVETLAEETTEALRRARETAPPLP